MRDGRRRSRAQLALAMVVLLAGACSSEDPSDPLVHVSLGDSFASGQGLPPINEDDPCHRSTKAYPWLVGGRDEVALTHGACAGARVADVTERSQHPGQPRQLDWVTAEADVVTVMIGGNDLGYGDVMVDCVFGPEGCQRRDPEVRAAIAGLLPTLTALYKRIGALAPAARLVVVGYPQVVPDPSTADLDACLGLSGAFGRRLTAEEARWLRARGEELAGAVRQAAEAGGARYVDALAAFAGHESCTTSPWIEPVARANPPASFHPNAKGHQALARLVKAELPER